MSLLAQRRAYLAAYRKSGSHEEAAKSMDLPADIHKTWSSDWLYRSAFSAIEKEMREAAAGKQPPPAPPKRPPGRPRKALPEPKVAKRIGRPPKAKAASPVEPPPEEPALPQDAPEAPASPEPAPPVIAHTFEGQKGHVTLYVPQGDVPAPPPEPERPRRQAQEQPADPLLDLTIATDETQKALIDEYGELDRRMQIRATDVSRYEVLKKAIKNWFCAVPGDADGCVEGDVYLLHLSACERERNIRSNAELIDVIGIDKFLELATVPLGVLENMLGREKVMFLTTETRTGSRRIKAIPKRPAAVATTG